MSKKQVSFKFDGDQVDALENIQRELKATSQADAIRKSLNLTSTLATAQRKGYKVMIQGPDGEEKELMFI